MPATDALGLLARALEQAGTIVARVRPDQAGLPTPCAGWDVRTLVNHTVFDLHLFQSMVTGGERPEAGADLIADDWPAAYSAAADTLLSTWRAKGVDWTMHSQLGDLPATWAAGQQLANMAVHSWDIARATDQSTALDPEVGEAALTWGRQNLKPELRGQTFGPEVAVPPDAPLYDRLAGFFGRTP